MKPKIVTSDAFTAAMQKCERLLSSAPKPGANWEVEQRAVRNPIRLGGNIRLPKKALKKLLDDLDKLVEEHDELGDTDVREQMYDAVHKSFIVPLPGYALPSSFGMFSDEGNRKVHAALQKFLAHPEVVADAKSLATPEARLAAFQDIDVESSEGNAHDEYFGYAEAP